METGFRRAAREVHYRWISCGLMLTDFLAREDLEPCLIGISILAPG
jgi:hypothetical protein